MARDWLKIFSPLSIDKKEIEEKDKPTIVEPAELPKPEPYTPDIEDVKDKIVAEENIEEIPPMKQPAWKSQTPDTIAIKKEKPTPEDEVRGPTAEEWNRIPSEGYLSEEKTAEKEWKLAEEQARTVDAELSEEELDRLSMSLSEQTKEDLIRTVRALNIKDLRIELDRKAIRIMTNIMNKCKNMNIDWFIAVAGGEGVGKSTLAFNLFALCCKLNGLNPIETLLRTLIYDEDELLKFISTIDPKEKFLPIDLDEGANVLFNRESMQVKRTYILKFFNVMRFLNSIVFIPTPNIKFLDKNVKAHRIKSIFYVPNRGTYWFYDKDQVDRMLGMETLKKWYWIEPKAVGSYGVNKELETIVTLIKENYVRMFSEKVKEFVGSGKAKRLENL